MPTDATPASTAGAAAQPAPGAAAPPARREARAHALVLAAAAALAYANTLSGRPVLDDGWAIFDNPLVKDLARLPEIFRQPWGYAGVVTVSGTWRPLATVTFALNHALGGRAPWGYHLVNLLLHALATVGVWALARRLVASVAPGRAAAAALAAGAVFAVHPVHAEAVASLVGRAEVLSALGVLGSLVALATPSWGRRRIAASAGALALGLLGKENAAVAPALLVLAAIACPAAFGLPARPGLRSPASRRAALALAGLAGVQAAVVLAYVAIRPIPLGLAVEAQWFQGAPRADVLLTMTRVLAEYLRLLVWPHPLGVDFYYASKIPTARGLGAEQVLATAIWLAALLAGAWLLARRPVAGLGVLWIFAALLPVLNVLAPVGVLMAERLLYLPSVGFCLAIGDAASGPLAAVRAGRLPRRAAVAATAAAAIAIAALAGRTLARNADWRDPLSLWEAELANAPLHPVVNNNLAVEYNGRGEHRRALERLDVTLAVAPRYWRALVNRGIALKGLGDRAAAEGAYREAAAIDPRAHEPPYFLGLLLLEEDRPGPALAELERAAAVAPWSVRALLAKATALERLGRDDEARDALLQAAALDPRDPEARARLGAQGR